MDKSVLIQRSAALHRGGVELLFVLENRIQQTEITFSIRSAWAGHRGNHFPEKSSPVHLPND